MAKRDTSQGAFNMRCLANACRDIANALDWPIGHEMTSYINRGHEVVTRVVQGKGGRREGACVYWCQPPNPRRRDTYEIPIKASVNS